jgi:hypothetical protein
VVVGLTRAGIPFYDTIGGYYRWCFFFNTRREKRLPMIER